MASKRPKPKKSKFKALEKAAEAARQVKTALGRVVRHAKPRRKKKAGRDVSLVDSSGYLTPAAQDLRVGEGILAYTLKDGTTTSVNSSSGSPALSRESTDEATGALGVTGTNGDPNEEDGFIAFDSGSDEEHDELSKRYAQYEAVEKEQVDAAMAEAARQQSTPPAVVEKIPEWPAPWHTPPSEETNCHGFLEHLDYEIDEYISYVQPLKSEETGRQDCIRRIQALTRHLWPSARAHVFGSFATGLHLPGADVDIVVVTPDHLLENRRREMFRLGDRIRSKGWSTRVDVISRARVPIVKFVDSATGLSVDISFEVTGGLDAVRTVNRWMSAEPAIKPLAMIVKQFLRRRRLNEVVHGGIGGYATVCMVVALLRGHPLVREGKIKARDNIGLLLLEFFQLYGQDFDYSRYALNMTGEMKATLKSKNVNMETQQPDGLAIQDPNDPNNNIARSSYNFSAVRRSFSHAWDLMRRLCVDFMELDAAARSRMSLLAPLLKYTEAEARIDRMTSPQQSLRHVPDQESWRSSTSSQSNRPATLSDRRKAPKPAVEPHVVLDKSSRQVQPPTAPSSDRARQQTARPARANPAPKPHAQSLKARIGRPANYDPFEPASTSSSTASSPEHPPGRNPSTTAAGKKKLNRGSKRRHDSEDGSDADSRTRATPEMRLKYWRVKGLAPQSP